MSEIQGVEVSSQRKKTQPYFVQYTQGFYYSLTWSDMIVALYPLTLLSQITYVTSYATIIRLIFLIIKLVPVATVSKSYTRHFSSTQCFT